MIPFRRKRAVQKLCCTEPAAPLRRGSCVRALCALPVRATLPVIRQIYPHLPAELSVRQARTGIHRGTKKSGLSWGGELRPLLEGSFLEGQTTEVERRCAKIVPVKGRPALGSKLGTIE